LTGVRALPRDTDKAAFNLIVPNGPF